MDKILSIADSLYVGFTKRELEAGMLVYTAKFVHQYQAFLIKEGLEEQIKPFIGKKSFNKDDLCFFCALPFANQRIFEAYKKFLPREIVQILDVLVWEDSLIDDDIQERFGLEIEGKQSRSYYSNNEAYQGVKAIYRFFKVLPIGDHNGWSYGVLGFGLLLPLPLRRALIDYYPKPKLASFIPLAEAPKTKHQFTNGEQTILTEFPRIFAYYRQGQIRVTNKNRPQLNTFPKMQRQLNLAEFFPDSKEKVLKNLRTALVSGLFVQLNKALLSDNLPLQIKRSLFQNIFLGKYYASGVTVLHYLKGMNNIESHLFTKVEDLVFVLLNEMPTAEWISTENLFKYLEYNIIRISPLRGYYAQDHLYYQFEDPDRDEMEQRYLGDKYRIIGTLYEKGVNDAYVRGIFFLLAAFGLCDLAYDTPDVSKLGKTAYSPYDGLQAIRLTHFGAYIAGKNDNYSPPEFKLGFNLKLSDHSLTILVDEVSKTADTVLAPFTQKVSERRYQTNASFFLQKCKSKKDLEHKINLFKDSVKTTLPENWNAFFNQLRQKVDPLEKVTNVQVFRIPPDNQELLQKIARDETLKPHILKAEDYHILVDKKDVPVLKKRLKELGYLLTK